MSPAELSDFGIKFQHKALASLLNDDEFFGQIQDMVNPQHFESESLVWIADRTVWYYREYRKPPTFEVFKQELDRLPVQRVDFKDVVKKALREIYAETQSSDLDYIKNRYLEFCKRQTLKQAILKCVDKLDRPDEFDSMRTLITTALNAGAERNLGHDLVADMDARLTTESRNVIPTGWAVVDSLMNGGLGGGEIGTIMAPSGAGKSWILSAIGKHAMEKGKRVLTISLELNERYLGNRYDTLFTGIETRELPNNKNYVKLALESLPGSMRIKFYPARTASASTIMAYINKLHISGFYPEMLIVDYADLLSPSMRTGNRYEDVGTVYEELRSLGGELDIPVWTASQVHRQGINVDVIEADKIAESFQKIMISDFIASVSRKATDKVNKTGRLHIVKNRFGTDGMTFNGKIDYATGVIEFFEPESQESIDIAELNSPKQDISDIKRALLTKFGEFQEDNLLGI